MTDTDAAKTPGRLACEAHGFALYGEAGRHPAVWASRTDAQRGACEAAAEAVAAPLRARIGELEAERDRFGADNQELRHLNAGQGSLIADLREQLAAVTDERDDLLREHPELARQRDDARAERDKAYRERAALVAFLAACYGGTLAYSGDDDGDDEWPVIFIGTPAGQMSWHIAPADVELFRPLGLRVTVAEPHWDGHTTEQKYQRLAELTRTVATGLYGPQPTITTENGDQQ